MKNNLCFCKIEKKEIEGIEVFFFVNNSGMAYAFTLNGKLYGIHSHIESENELDAKTKFHAFIQHAEEVVKSSKEANKLNLNNPSV